MWKWEHPSTGNVVGGFQSKHQTGGFPEHARQLA